MSKDKRNKHLNVTFTSDEFARIKKILYKYGSVSMVTRNLLLNFIREQEEIKRAKDSGSMGQETGTQDETVDGGIITESRD